MSAMTYTDRKRAEADAIGAVLDANPDVRAYVIRLERRIVELSEHLDDTRHCDCWRRGDWNCYCNRDD